MEIVKAKDLKLRDEIRSFDGGYGTATVKKVDDNFVTVFRPFVHSNDVETTCGVCCYVGIEEYHILRNDTEYDVYQRYDVR